MGNFSSPSSGINAIKAYTIPKLHTGKEWYIGFYAFDPALDRMHRKKIKLNHIDKITDRRRYANGLIVRLVQKLEEGWNPWIDAESSNAYKTIEEVFERYRMFLRKRLEEGNLRRPTVYSYFSRLNMLEEWNRKRPVPIRYIYQLDRAFVTAFLNYVYIDLNNSVVTHNHYLVWLGNMTGWMVEQLYLPTKPTEGMETIRQKGEKNRTVIPPHELVRLRELLTGKNGHFLLACYLVYYTLLRPKEISMLRIRDIHLQKQTIYVGADVSKNRHSDVVTLPVKVIHLMLELKLFDYPEEDFIFSDDFIPGMKYRHPKHFGDYWVRHVKKPLRWPEEYKFYSLKDTGITNMLHNCDVLSVRDQARHSDISVTNIYAAKSDANADRRLKNYEDDF